MLMCFESGQSGHDHENSHRDSREDRSNDDDARNDDNDDMITVLTTTTEMGSVMAIIILKVMHTGESDGPGDVDLLV